MQEGGAAAADVNERGLHSWQHPDHASHADIADQPARRRALDVHFLHHALLDDGDARLLRRDVDQDLFSQAGLERNSHQGDTKIPQYFRGFV